jgi:hypothetical protein
VIVRVILVAAFRPAARQTASAGLASDETSQRKSRMRTLARCRARHTARQNRLDAIEQLFRDQRFEVAALAANTVLGHVYDAGVQLISEQHADCCDVTDLPRRLVSPQILARFSSCSFEYWSVA